MSAYVMRWTFWSGIECSSTGIGVSWDSSICVEMCEISTGCSTGIGVSRDSSICVEMCDVSLGSDGEISFAFEALTWAKVQSLTSADDFRIV